MNLTTQCPVQLDLGTINEVQQVVVRALRDLVCNWEQKAHDAGPVTARKDDALRLFKPPSST
jgi:hypothetical protein